MGVYIQYIYTSHIDLKVHAYRVCSIQQSVYPHGLWFLFVRYIHSIFTYLEGNVIKYSRHYVIKD